MAFTFTACKEFPVNINQQLVKNYIDDFYVALYKCAHYYYYSIYTLFGMSKGSINTIFHMSLYCAVSRYGELFIESQVFLSHVYLVLPFAVTHRNFVKTFGIRKLDSLGHHAALVAQ